MELDSTWTEHDGACVSIADSVTPTGGSLFWDVNAHMNVLWAGDGVVRAEFDPLISDSACEWESGRFPAVRRD